MAQFGNSRISGSGIAEHAKASGKPRWGAGTYHPRARTEEESELALLAQFMRHDSVASLAEAIAERLGERRGEDLIAAAGLDPRRAAADPAAAAEYAGRINAGAGLGARTGRRLAAPRRSSQAPRTAHDSTTTAFLAVSQNLSRYQAMTAAEPAVKTASAYYEANIGSVKSISDLVGNYRLLSYALNAYGLGDQINAKGLITKVLEGGVSNPKSLANTLPNSQMEGVCGGFQFRRQRGDSAFIGERGRDDDERLCRAAAGKRSGRPGRRRPACALFPARRADGHQRIRNLGRSQSSGGGGRRSWGSRPTARGDLQPQTLSELMPISNLQDPAKLTQLTERFTAMYDYTYGPSSGATSGLTVDSGNATRSNQAQPRSSPA